MKRNASGEGWKEMVEFGAPSTIEFRDQLIRAKRHLKSGYLSFDPPSDQELSDYYAEEYRDNNPHYYTIEKDYDAGRCGHYVGVLMELANEYALPQGFRAHEFGCAYGGIVAKLRSRSVQATGSDINGDAVAEGRTIKGNAYLFEGDNQSALAKIDEELDMIYALHVMEHDPHLFDNLAAMAGKLSDRGILFLEVPNAMYIKAVLLGIRGHPWARFPDHLHLLSPGYLGDLCDTVGMEPLAFQTVSSFQVDPGLPWLFANLSDSLKKRWDFLFRTYGLGMALQCVLTPKESALAAERAEQIRAVRARIECHREQEIAVRDFMESSDLAEAPPAPNPDEAGKERQTLMKRISRHLGRPRR